MSKEEAEEEIESGGEVIPLKRLECLVLRLDTPKGRGVFASKDIPARTVIEVCPVLVLDPAGNEEHIKNTELYNYTYNWPYEPPSEEKEEGENGVKTPQTITQAVIFGLGSMFNHSRLYQNVGWERDVKNKLITYITLRDVKEGEELCISYGQRLTFRDTDESDLGKDPDDWTDLLNIIEYID